MIRFSLISAAALAGAMAANAGELPLFSEVDTDFDGVISQAEFVAYKVAGGEYTEEEAAAKFTEIAGDDGVISADEWAALSERKESKESSDTSW
ncbi:MAG: hypothetical protein ACK4MQ_10350 [Hyphomonas sp.]